MPSSVTFIYALCPSTTSCRNFAYSTITMELFSLAGGSHAPTAGMVDPDKIQSRTESQLHQIWDEEADTRARMYV